MFKAYLELIESYRSGYWRACRLHHPAADAQCLKNVLAILDAAGSSMDKIISATFILRDPADFAGMNEEWQAWFPIDPPARQGAMLPVDVAGLRVSIAAIAET